MSEYSLERLRITQGMRDRARAAGVRPDDDAAVRAYHARVTRALAELRQREGV